MTTRDNGTDNHDDTDPAALLQRHLPLVRRLSLLAARRSRMTHDEAEELQSRVFLKLIDRNYAVLRTFAGRSHIATYLTIVIRRTALDFRTAEWGKWRPSAPVSRAGRVAVALDRIMTTQGLSFDGAWETLDGAGRQRVPAGAKERLRDLLRPRARRRLVDLAEAVGVSCPPSQDAIVLDRTARQRAARSLRVVSAAVASLPAIDRTLLSRRFRDNRNVADIARELAMDQKCLYRRFTHILARLRRRLESDGVDQPSAMELLDSDVLGQRWETTPE